MITDGEVGQTDVSKCDDLLTEMNFKADFVKVLLINGGIPDISVSCAFTRSNPHQVLLYKNDTPEQVAIMTKDNIQTVKKLLVENKITSYQSFLDNYSILENYIRSQCVGRMDDPNIRHQLLLMGKEIVKNQSMLSDDELTSALVSSDNAKIQDAMKMMLLNYDRSLANEYHCKMQWLLECTKG